MLYSDFAKTVRWYTSTDTDTFTNDDMILVANFCKDEIAKRIKLKNEGYFGTIMTRDLEAGNREYSMPSDLLSTIERVEAKLDGVTWKPLEEIQLTLEDMATDEASITSYFANRKPAYDLFRGSLFIYSGSEIIGVSGGLKLWCFVWPQNFVSLSEDLDLSTPRNSTSVGFPREFHELLARRVSIAWKGKQDQPIALTETEQRYEADLQAALDSIGDPNEDRAIGMQERVDNGFDY